MNKIFNEGKLISLEKVITLIYDDVSRYAKYYIKDDKLAEDILHNVFETILVNEKKKDKTFDSVHQFKYYINMSIKNKFIDKTRVQKRSPVRRYEEEVFDVMVKTSKSDIRTDQVFIDEYDELIREQNKIKVNASKSHLTSIQYLVMTLRMNDYSFKQIAEITGASINTVLGQMRYSKGNFKKQFEEKRIREKRRKRFKEGRSGKFDYEDLLLQLPPYQYFAVKMKSDGRRFEDIAKLEGVPTSTVYYRFLWAKKNLKKMVKSEEDYKKIISYIDSLNTNVGGKNWHKIKEGKILVQ